LAVVGMIGGLAIEIGGVHVPDGGPVFLAALALHVAAGATAVVAGAAATTARKRPGRHPRAGTAYLYAMVGVFATATVMAAVRWRHDWHLFVIATVALGLALLGRWARRRRTHRWLAWHGTAMAGSYIALFTGFYVDNGAQLPLWDRLPHQLYWLLPAAVGIPLTGRALIRNGAIRAAGHCRPRLHINAGER
jgi:4-amino-4-deoxy-L-arabinose transferase-like glycosyltransferase